MTKPTNTPPSTPPVKPAVLRGTFHFDEMGHVVSFSFEPTHGDAVGTTLAAQAAYRLGRASTEKRFVLPGISWPIGSVS